MNRRQKKFLIVMGAVLFVALLGAEASSRTRAKKQLPKGNWGGKHINLTITDAGAQFEFDCGSGKINGPIMLDRKGRFRLQGTYTDQVAAPSATPQHQTVTYAGQVKGKQMTLKITFTENSKSTASYSLRFGQTTRLTKCPASPPNRSTDDKPAPIPNGEWEN